MSDHLKTISLLISPEAKGAFFADYLEITQAELRQCCPDIGFELRQIGPLDFIDVHGGDAKTMAKLSFVQGMFERDGDALIPLTIEADWLLPQDFIFGSKFKGKTNERLTQMLINLGLAKLQKPAADVKLLDPMCGRGTTLFWAMAYGLRAFGIDEDRAAIPDIERNFKKWAKLTRLKHRFQKGFLGAKNKHGDGAYLDMTTDHARMRIGHGDAASVKTMLGQIKVNLIISDLPYGVQHGSKGSKNPIETLQECARAWKEILADDGTMVLSFNRKNPRRTKMVDIFESAGWQVDELELPHRMSESIVRDVLIAKLG